MNAPWHRLPPLSVAQEGANSMNKTGCHSLVAFCVSAAVLVAATPAQDAGTSTGEGPAVRIESGMVPAVIYLWPKGNEP
jgi:hypothetical protein